MTDHDALVAYALRDEYVGTVTQVLETDAKGRPTKTQDVPKFSGGLINLGVEELELAEALEEGAGTIVLDVSANPLAVEVLDAIPVLKRVEVPEGATSVIGYNERTATALREEAGRRSIAGAASARKADLERVLELDDARIAAGEPTPDDYSVAGILAAADAANDETPEA